MSPKIYKTTNINNSTLTAYVWEVDGQWTSQGTLTQHTGDGVNETRIHPAQTFFPDEACAGEAALQAMKDALGQ